MDTFITKPLLNKRFSGIMVGTNLAAHAQNRKMKAIVNRYQLLFLATLFFTTVSIDAMELFQDQELINSQTIENKILQYQNHVNIESNRKGSLYSEDRIEFYAQTLRDLYWLKENPKFWSTPKSPNLARSRDSQDGRKFLAGSGGSHSSITTPLLSSHHSINGGHEVKIVELAYEPKNPSSKKRSLLEKLFMCVCCPCD